MEEEVRRARGAEQAARRRLQEFSPRAVEQAAAEADRRRRRLEELFEQRLATRAEVEQAGAAARLEARNLQQAREHRSRLQQELASAEADLRVASLRRDDAASSSQRRPMLDLAEAESAYRLVKERLAGLRMSAPFPGTVLTAPEAGQQAWAGAPFFTLADLSYLELVAPVAATVAHTIAPGAAVTALLPTDPPSAVEAKVESVTYLPDREKASYTLRVIVPNPDPDVILAGLEGAIEYRHHER